MQIASVACELPESVLTNEDVLDLVDQSSREDFKGDFDKTLRIIRHLFRTAGSRERRALRTDENPFDYISRCVGKALLSAGLEARDIDLVIHASIDRRVMEPGMSFFLANALGMHSAQCFDVLEACSSWVRAADIAQGYLMSGRMKNILIITAEFGLHEGEWGRESYKISKVEDLEHSFASYTLGESATATILNASDTPWEFVNETVNQYSELCVVPIAITREGTMQYNQVSLSGEGARKFSCHAMKMSELGEEPSKRVFADRYLEKLPGIDLVIPHSHTSRDWQERARQYQVDVPYYFTFPTTGNLLTGSIPGALAMAAADGTLHRGDRVAAWMVAAGLTFTSFDFIY